MSTLTVIYKRIDSAGGVKYAMEELRRARGTSARNPEAEHGCLEALLAAPGRSWGTIEGALRTGGRGLNGGLSPWMRLGLPHGLAAQAAARLLELGKTRRPW
jgi:hypothetical protein